MYPILGYRTTVRYFALQNNLLEDKMIDLHISMHLNNFHTSYNILHITYNKFQLIQQIKWIFSTNEWK